MNWITDNDNPLSGKSTDERINQNDAAITLAHELGHYLGLRHVFSEGGTTSMCTDTDYCKDTPSYNRSEYEQWLNNLDKQNKYQLKDLAKRYSCEKGEYEAHNIMDYAYCFYNEITLEQRKRIRHILNYSPLIPGPKESRIDTRGVRKTGQQVFHRLFLHSSQMSEQVLTITTNYPFSTSQYKTFIQDNLLLQYNQTS